MEIYAEILSHTANLTDAPEYIMVLPLGYISSENGDFLVDRESFRMMKEHMERRAVDIVVDYEHHISLSRFKKKYYTFIKSKNNCKN